LGNKFLEEEKFVIFEVVVVVVALPIGTLDVVVVVVEIVTEVESSSR